MRKGEVTRSAILDEAMQTASLVGLGGLSIGQLAETTEMSKSGLFAHFRSKEQLQLQVLERTRERFTDVVIRPALSAPRGIARVRRTFDGWLGWADDVLNGGCIFVAASVELDDQPGALRDALVRSELDWLELLATVAGTAVSEGEFRDDLDVEQFAYEEHGVMLVHHHASRLLHDPRAADRTRRAFDSLVAAARGPG
ncbi:MAG: TetR family transcriptional regulator [Propionibacteriales bacterium]|nr:TetR family transcriptional regulator [Propionibacteriales bacterium]